ncbi:Citryl-CoA lyase [Moritella viscosa]|uniref:HpcH/HpaI aldolase/citrate lyase family protein n=1 Tax=Moritella viscosa TaxID=80854 RepID=UPI00092370FE|nr:CoA ester lyase [Moritella viscosa]SGZ09390.1 Citryl-CoA lyase [Moritella viscosa]
MKHRSFLCAPPGKFELVNKSIAYKASVALFDLEDSVPENKKKFTRELVLSQLKNKPAITTAVRINSLHTKFGLEDILGFVEAQIVPDIIMIPKVESGDDLSIVEDVLQQLRPSMGLYAVIETIKGVRKLNDIIKSPANLQGLVFGAADFSENIGRHPSTLDLTYAMNKISMAANEVGIQAIDSPCFSIDDITTLEMESNLAKRLGYQGKIAIHPHQVKPINELFGLTKKEIALSQSIIEKIGLIEDLDMSRISKINNSMIGPPFLKLAEKLCEMES